MNALLLCFLIKINHTIHNTVICDGHTVHAKFLDSGDQFFDFIGAIQQTVFCMNVQMCKIHAYSPFS